MVSLFAELISGIEPILVMRYDRRQLKHPISSIHRLSEGAGPPQTLSHVVVCGASNPKSKVSSDA